MGQSRCAIIAALVAPAYGEAVDRKSLSQHAVTPDEIARRLQLQAERTKLEGATRPARSRRSTSRWPHAAEEYRALGKYIVVLMVAVSQNQQELPLKRVYVEAGGKTIDAATDLERAPNAAGRLAYRTRARARIARTGFYLAPAAP